MDGRRGHGQERRKGEELVENVPIPLFRTKIMRSGKTNKLTFLPAAKCSTRSQKSGARDSKHVQICDISCVIYNGQRLDPSNFIAMRDSRLVRKPGGCAFVAQSRGELRNIPSRGKGIVRTILKYVFSSLSAHVM